MTVLLEINLSELVGERESGVQKIGNVSDMQSLKKRAPLGAR
jgi:hypothetical protein